MNRKIGYAVLGLGIGRAHVDAAATSENGRLIAVCDLIQSKMDEVVEYHPKTLTYTSFDEMLKNPDIEIVSICLPSAMHSEFAVKAMEAGKNVLIEKPIDITVEAALKIEAARVKTGMIAGVIHQNRNNACMKPMKNAVESGKIGKIILGTFSVKWYRDQHYYDNGGWRGTWEMDGGGSLMNQAVHTVDLMQWLMGDLESVTSSIGIFDHDIQTEDLTASLIKFKSGAVATFVSTTCAYPGICTDIQLYGSNGTIEVDGDSIKTWKFKDAEDSEEEEIIEKYGQGNHAAVALDPALATGHSSQVNDIIDAVLYKRLPQITPLEAIKSVKIVNAIYESAKTGKTIYF